MNTIADLPVDTVDRPVWFAGSIASPGDGIDYYSYRQRTRGKPISNAAQLNIVALPWLSDVTVRLGKVQLPQAAYLDMNARQKSFDNHVIHDDAGL